tara:strand:+ start:119 stop:478 length:360 start_codon:yes stop_codon:yes gene_type:complete
MKTSIRKELTEHILDYINEGIVIDGVTHNIEEIHFYCFNEDYYIIYHSEAIEWLKKHNIDAFEAIEIVRDYETEHFGEFTTDLDAESIVNMLAYIYGEEIICSLNFDNVSELKEQLENN